MSASSVVPDTDLARIRTFCEARSPAEHADQMRVELAVRGRTVTIVQHELFGNDWLDLMVARLKFEAATAAWTLYWPDSDRRFHRYEDLAPGPVDSLLTEVDRDPFGIFWG